MLMAEYVFQKADAGLSKSLFPTPVHIVWIKLMNGIISTFPDCTVSNDTNSHTNSGGAYPRATLLNPWCTLHIKHSLCTQ